MKLDTEQCIETPAENSAMPLARAVEPREHGLFQTMDELRTRHGGAPRTRDRILHAAAALAGGSLLVAALYGVILSLE